MTLDIRELPDVPVQYLVPRDGKDRPMVVPKGGGKPIPLTRTTTFIDCIEDKSALAKYGKRRVLHGVAVKPSLLADALHLDPEDPEDKRKLDALAERAMDASGANDKREKGTELHGLSEIVDAGKPLPDSVCESDKLDMAAYRFITLFHDMKFSHIEKFVVVMELGVGGTPDRIVWYSGPGPDGEHIEGWFIFDLKTGTVDYGGLKMASQLAIYSRAEFYDPLVMPAPPYHKSVTKKDDPEGFAAHKAWQEWCNTEFDAELAATAYGPIPEVNQDLGIILNLPAGSGHTELYWADLAVGWEAATLATTIRRMRSLSSKALRRFGAPTAVAVGSSV